MIIKSIETLKKNPILILFYAVYMVVTALIILLLYPRDFSQFINTTDYSNFDFIGYFDTMIKMMIAAGIMFILGLLFASGYGSMISEAVLNGKTSASSFFPGIGKYFVRVLLSLFLLMAFTIGFSIVNAIITIPITMILAVTAQPDIFTILVSFVTMAVVIFVIPLVFLWFPALFIDDTGVIQSLKNGVKAGLKNYWKLILLILVFYIPMIIYMLIDFKSIASGNMFTPGYIIVMIIEVIFSIIFLPMLFLIYSDYRSRMGYNNINI